MASFLVQNPLGTGSDISVTPAWVLGVVRFKYPSTFSRTVYDAKGLFPGASFSKSGNVGTATQGGVLVIDSSCPVLTVTTNKESHLSSLNATLLPSEINYMREILPGDWLFAWMCSSREAARSVVSRLRSGEACNRWDDGLKFVGRVQTIHRRLSVAPNGLKSLRYQLSGTGFREFDTEIFYDPNLIAKETGAGADILNWSAQFHGMLERFQNWGQTAKGGLSTGTAISELIRNIYGRGLRPGLPGDDNALQARTGLIGNAEAPLAYTVPWMVGRILGRTSRSKPGGAMAYSDFMETLIGLQKYTAGQGANANTASSTGDAGPLVEVFTPDGIKGSRGTIRSTKISLMGSFYAAMPSLVGRNSVWNILRFFLNPAVNEMYTCLRTNWEGSVVPTLVVRQLPFTTPLISQAFPNRTTAFLSLPRWKIAPEMIRELDEGRTDALRFNMSHVYAQVKDLESGFKITDQLVSNPPRRDNLDIERSGLRIDMMTVPVYSDEQFSGPKKWMTFRADILFGQHLLLNGTLTTVGIQLPICEGDNAEIGNGVYHIEGLSHRCVLGPDGMPTFTTTLALSHGMRVDAEARVREAISKGVSVPDAAMYLDLADDTFEGAPGLTVEGGDTGGVTRGDGQGESP